MKKRFFAVLLVLMLLLSLLPAGAMAAFDRVNTRGTLGIYTGTDTYDIRGWTRDGREIRTTFRDYGYSTVVRHEGAEKNINLTSEDTPVSVNGVAGLSVKVDADFISGERYLKVTYTLLNDSDTDITGLDLGVHADIMIGGDDRASIYKTSTGFRMVNTKTSESDPGYNKQFNLACKGAAGVDDVSTMWFGQYGSRQRNLFQDVTATEYTGGDSGLAFSWQGMTVPKRTVTDSSGAVWQYASGSLTRCVLFSVSENAAPPDMPDHPLRLYLTAVGESRITVNALVTDEPGLTDTLYYTCNGGAENVLGSVVADGTQKVVTGVIDLSGQVGTHVLQMWIMNSGDAMSGVIEKTLRINAAGSIDVLNPDGSVETTLVVPTPADNVVEPLPAPISPVWTLSDGRVFAQWAPVAGATQYYVQLYHNGEACGALQPSGNGTTLDCTAAMNLAGSGAYTFTVIADTGVTSSQPSAPSGVHNFVATGRVEHTLTIMANGQTLDTRHLAMGETADLHAPTPQAGFRFSHWSSSNGGRFSNPNNVSTTFTMPDADVTVTAQYVAHTQGGGSAGVMNSMGQSGAVDIDKKEIVVYNARLREEATIWLCGTDLIEEDLLLTPALAAGGDYEALRALAGDSKIFRIYDISLQSGKHTLQGDYLLFDLNAKYAGQSFTLVHKKADGGSERFVATADDKGDLRFGPLYELSPFMLLHGANGVLTAAPMPPATGEPLRVLPLMGLLLVGLGLCFMRRRGIR